MLGTPLMQTSATTVLDLPQKIIVYKENNKVHLAYNDPFYLKERHIIENAEVLNTITNKVTGN